LPFVVGQREIAGAYVDILSAAKLTAFSS
jgi:hypothetical protein